MLSLALLLLVVHWRHQPSRAAPPHALPRASVRRLLWSSLFTTPDTLAVCRSSSTTLRADSPQHAPPHCVGGLLVLQHRSQFFRAMREEVVDSMSPALSWEATPSTGITSSGPAVSED